MSLASDLDDLFGDGKESIINEPLRFKVKLGVDESAFEFLGAKEHLATFTKALRFGWDASKLARSPGVAGSFFARSSILSTLGLGAATTPIVWILAAGVLSGAAYVGVRQLFVRSKDTHQVIVPPYINTPLDVIAVALMELMLPVSLKVANSDNVISKKERAVFRDYYVDQWGYNSLFLDRMITEYEENLDSISFAALSKSLKEYCRSNPDTDPKIILDDFLAHVTEVIEANGDVGKKELDQLNYLTHLMTQAAENSQIEMALQAAKSGVSKSVETTSEVASAGIDGAEKLLKTGIEKSSPYAEKAASAAAQGLSATTDLAGKLLRNSIEKSSPYAEKATRAAAQGFSTTTDFAGKLYKKAQIDSGMLKGLFKRKSPPDEDG